MVRPTNRILKLLLPILILMWWVEANGQTATVSIPFSVGRTGCGSGSSRINYYSYNSTTNALGAAATPAGCIPQLRIGGSSFTFTSSLASVSYNPKDQNLYYLYTVYTPSVRTYVWRWPVGTCPTSTSPRLDTVRSFAYDILGVVFDKSGNGYMLEFSPTGPPYTAFLRSIDFTTGTYGQADTLSLTNNAKIYTTGTGDVALAPSGQMYFVVDNKLFTPDYTNYGTAAKKVTTTYIDTVRAPAAGASLVGLTYAQGELLAAYSGTGCVYKEVNPLTGDTTAVTSSTAQSTSDFASVISGVGVSKKLVSVTPTGTPNQYTAVYDVYVRNYGNYPLTNVQVADTLSKINGVLNYSLVSVAFQSNPAGLVLNPSYNGSTNANLLNGTGTLPNFPVANNFAVIRITVTLSNILTGVIYNNQAYGRATGFAAASVLDASTNGTSADLNSNDKPDDAGESQPTPLLIAVTSTTPPCASLSNVLFTENFGTGANTTAVTAGGNTPAIGYTASAATPLPLNSYKIASNATAGNATDWLSLTDHTTGTGRMLMVNADALNSTFYRDTVPVLCANQQYSLIFYAAFPGNSSYQTLCTAFGGFKYPSVQMNIRDAVTGVIITQNSTGSITSSSWGQYGLKFILPTGFSSVVIELVNEGLGGCGNDILIDDIQFGSCSPLPTVSIGAGSMGCLGSTTTFSATLSDPSVISGTIVYQWQVSNDNVTFTDIVGATSSTYSIASLAAANTGKYYRVLVAALGNIANPSCRYTSPGYLLNAKSSSVAATSALSNKNNICPGDAVTLQVNGGTLGTNAVWRWYSASCGGTLVGTGTSITVNPLVTTTYFVRAEGDCNNTACVSRTITVNCDIDDDNDGITDLAESGGLDPNADDDFDGIENYMDATYPGFIDVNSDGINDNFDNDRDGIINSRDLDSDNDGIPDVVESGGVDANGDGVIDNYTDTDGDGLSQNVDANNTGASGSGTGLGLVDTDGDGVANVYDLDSDNDGIPDVLEAGGTDANNDGKIDGYTDTDLDGFSQNVDGDTNNDGVAENSAAALLRTGADVNSDGRADSYPNKNFDSDGRANAYDLDSDNDGITDVREAGFADADNNGFADGTKGADGWDDTIDALATLTLRNSDGDINKDYLDIDSDNDGIPDNIEGMSTSSYRLPSYADSDNDGLDNMYDAVNGFGGSGITPNDQDGDAIPDYIDTDTDGDSVADVIEASDFNSNCDDDDLVTLTGIDTDGDGLDNRFDLLNSSIKGTSAYMGNFGSLVGDPSPGSRTMVSMCNTGFINRDWRYLPYALKAEFIGIQAKLAGEAVVVKWVVTCDEVIHHFEVERTADNITYTSVGSVQGTGSSCKQTPFEFTDVTVHGDAGQYQYRIKAISTTNLQKISQVVKITVVAPAAVSIFPVPAKQFIKIGLSVEQPHKAIVRIMDTHGREVIHTEPSLHRGANVLTIHEIGRLTPGVYYVQLDTGEGLAHEKIIVQ